MLRCKKCKKWLTSITIDFELEHECTIIKALNVPAKQCPVCKELTVDEFTKERIVKYANENHTNTIDFAKCEDDESASSQFFF